MDSITIIIAEVDELTYGYGWIPSKRTITIELTDEQKTKIKLGKYEHIADVIVQAQEEK